MQATLSRLSKIMLGCGGSKKLPDRIRADVETQQIQSERLIAWIQAGIVLFFGVFYTLSPKTSGDTAFMPVPWVLGVYAGFTLFRLWLLYRDFAPRALLVFSVVMDMALLMGLIWSFHLQYDQPASFYLKAPTLLYVFIFIALRALRFDPVYVLASGLVAAAGWVFLLLYALFLDDNHIGGPMITGDYIEYMTSYHILVGAEVDKIVSILVVTGILALVLVRARRTLEKAVSDGATAASLSRFVADDVVQKVTEGEAELKPGDAEEKIATVMFTDIEGFSTISEAVSPTELMDLLNDYFEKVTQVLDRHEGLVAQFQGDALMVVFRNHEDFDPATITPGPDMPRICAHRAVAAAREIVETLNDHPFGGLEIPMRTRCGLNTGVMVLGTVGSHNRLIFTAHGDEVNIAARLEQLNKQYGSYILMSEGTAQMSGQFEAMREMGEVVVRGRSTPTRVYSVGPQLAPAQPYLSPIGSGRPEAAQ